MTYAPGGRIELTAPSPSERLSLLFDAHAPRLYRLARRLSGDADSARDLVQETFLRAARHAGRLPRDEAGGEAWLVRTLVNLCRDGWRRRAVRRRLQPPPAPGPADPESAAVARGAVQTALAMLPPRQRAIVVLRELEGLETRDIAALLGVAGVTVRWHLAAGRKRLRELLQPETGRSR